MATYWVKSGTGGTGAGTSWANAAESLTGLLAAQAVAGGDTIYVHNTHANSVANNINLTIPETGTGLVRILCVDGGDPTGASLVDGTVGNLTTGASETANGNYYISLTSVEKGKAFYHGIAFTAGAGGNSGSVAININNFAQEFSYCTFFLNTTHTSPYFTLGSSYQDTFKYNHCLFRFSTTSQYIKLGGAGQMIWMKDCAIHPSGSSPTTLFKLAAQSRACYLEASGCDWSKATNVVDVSSGLNGIYKFINSVIATPSTGTHSGLGGPICEFQACAAVDGTNGADILSYYYEDCAGNVQDSQTVYKTTGGATGEQDDGTDTPYSLEMNPSAIASTSEPLYTPWAYTLVGSTGDKTVSMIVAHTESAVLTTSDIFMEVEYMGEPGLSGTQRVANSPHSQFEVDDACPVVSGTLARDVYSVGSNRTDDGLDDWTGLSSEKEHTLTASINCAEVGYIRCRVGLTKDTTNPVYVEPKISVA